jgi:hypothetical protein
MIKFIDIDNTICTTPGTDYASAAPIPEAIATVNQWYDEGHKITYWTARGMLHEVDYRPLTESQLKAWGCKYHELRLDKPLFDEFYDDRAFHAVVLRCKH